jgi:hypothetical protein
LPDLGIIRFKLRLIEKEITDTKPLADLLGIRPPDGIEIRAVGAVLQAVYNGMESVLLLFQDPKIGTVASDGWHRDLLENAQRKGLIDEELELELEMLMKFRHKFRHSYGFMLEWPMMSDLFLRLPSIAKAFSANVDKLLGD